MNASIITTDALQSIPQFCEENGISRAFFYKLKDQGKAPKIIKLGSRSMITPEARLEWMEQLNQEARA